MPPRGPLAAGGWVVLASAALELTAREVARRPLLPWVPDAWPPAGLAALAAAAAAFVFLAAPRPRPRPCRGAPLLFAALFAAGVAAQIGLGARLQSDGFYYFAYLRSLAFDGDVEFSNDYKLLGLGDKTHLFRPTRTGHAHSAWTVGPAILWAPFFAAGHLVAKDLHDGNPDVTPNGISYPYRQAVCIAGLFYGLLGCWFMFGLTSMIVPRPLAAGAVTATVGGSFMLWYLVKEPSMTHAPSMALVAGFAWAWMATRGTRTRRQWVLLGALAGVMTLVRWQNAIFAILPAADVLLVLWSTRRTGGADQRRALVDGLLFTAAAALAFTPQMLAWQAIYGTPLAVSPVGPEIRFFDPHLVDILWSSRNGLFSLSPVLFAGAAGLCLFALSRPGPGLPMLAAVGAMTYFNACIQDWWGSAGYGGRRFDGTLPFFSIGAAWLAHAGIELVRRRPSLAAAAAGTLFVLWNVTQMAVAQAGLLRIGEAVSFGDTMAAQARAFHGWFGNPFTYPISLGYALRNGVSPGRYDLLSANRFLSDPRQPYGRIDVGSGDEWALGGGWHAAEREATTTFRWATASATILAPLDRSAPLRVQVRLHAFGHAGAPPQSVSIVVNGRIHGPVPVQPDWHVIELDVPEDAWRSGVNRVELRFDWERSPASAGLGGDTRPLAAAVDYVRLQEGGREESRQ